MWDRAKERIGMTDNVVFKDIRALGATDAARSGEKLPDIQTRLAYTSSRTSEIYVKEVIPGNSEIDLDLSWKPVQLGIPQPVVMRVPRHRFQRCVLYDCDAKTLSIGVLAVCRRAWGARSRKFGSSRPDHF